MKLTDSRIKSFKAKTKRHIIWEDGRTGMGIRITPTGRKSFIFMYRFENKARMMTLGPYPRVGLAQARLKVAEAKAKLEELIDPGTDYLQAKSAERRAFTVNRLAEEYLEKYARPRKKTAFEDERLLGKDILPFIGRKKAKLVRRRDLIEILDNIVERGSPVMANRCLALLSKLFNFALSRDILDTTPCAAITMPSKESSRDRVLTEEEIKIFWSKLDSANMSEASRVALKFQLITIQRKGEIIKAEWPEFDLDNRMWTIPSEKSKNGLPHRVPLSDMALDILEQIKALPNGSGWLFPSRITATHAGPNSIDHAVKRNLEVIGIPKFTPHDLRRTGASHMASMGIMRLVIAKTLNHVETSVTATYDRYSYSDEKRKALDTWGRKLESIITGKKGKVIPIRR